MKKHLIVILILIIVVPVWAISLIWNNQIANENDAIRYRFEKVLEDRLSDYLGHTRMQISVLEQDLLKETDLPAFETEAVRTLQRKNPLIQAVLVMDRDGHTRYPQPPLSVEEGRSIESIFPIARDIRPSAQGKSISTYAKNTQLPVLKEEPAAGFPEKSSDHGWHTQFGNYGLRLFFWRKTPADDLILIEINRSALLGRIVSGLPTTAPEFKDAVVLADEFGRLLYMWGDTSLVKTDIRPQASVPLKYPLGVLRLYYYTRDVPHIDLHLYTLMLALACSLFILGGYFFWEHMRTLDETAQKVSFVNQVSHELKTPLTNIRLYAELLRERIGDDPDALKKVGVIEAESRRLSRLIGNALAFSSGDRLRPQPQKCDVIQILNKVIDSFRPSLEKKGVAVSLDCRVKEAILDADFLEQIMINLIGNVEKYAADGKYLGIEAWEQQGRLHVRVQDRGTGIPHKWRKKVFKPFFRGRNSTTEGVSGTGIGLSLSRKLAELHGGTLVLAGSDKGACFEVIL